MCWWSSCLAADAAKLSVIENDFSEQIAAHTGKVLVAMSDISFIAILALRMLLIHLKSLQPPGGGL